MKKIFLLFFLLSFNAQAWYIPGVSQQTDIAQTVSDTVYVITADTFINITATCSCTTADVMIGVQGDSVAPVYFNFTNLSGTATGAGGAVYFMDLSETALVKSAGVGEFIRLSPTAAGTTSKVGITIKTKDKR